MKNAHVHRLLTGSPLQQPPGIGMSDRPAFYAGRSMFVGDLSSKQLVTFYRELQRLESSKHVPEGAAAAFASMVDDSPALNASCFVTNLLELDRRDYTWTPGTASSGNWDKDPDGGALSTVLSVFSGGSLAPTYKDLVASLNVKRAFQREVGLPETTGELVMRAELDEPYVRWY